MSLARRLALAAMLLVTSWSLWVWAQPAAQHSHAETHAAKAHPAEAGDGEKEGPAPINWFEFGTETPPFVAMFVNFGILAAGYYLFGRKPIAAALANRRDSIAKDIEDAQRMKREAEERAKTYQAKLAALEEEVRIVREALVRAGEAERDRIVADAEAKAERMKREAEFLVLQEQKQAKQDLWRDAFEAAVATAEELLKKRVTPADHERLAEEYLKDLGAKPRGERTAESAYAIEPRPRGES